MRERIEQIIICAVQPYFLDRNTEWFKENFKNILNARKKHLFWQNNTIFCKIGNQVKLSFLIRKLIDLGYEKVFFASEPGEFSQHGGLIRVCPVNLDKVVEIDFFGNKIENIYLRDLKGFNFEKSREILKKRINSQKLFFSLKDLKKGDYLVHLDHGIGKYCGKVKIKKTNYYLLEYAYGDKIYVPEGLERKLSRYYGFKEPKISKLRGTSWLRTKKRVKESAIKFAEKLLSLYFKKEVSERRPYQFSNLIEEKLEESFLYQETPDQIKAINDIKEELKRRKPADILLIGDVGFGKTEVVLRIAAQVVFNQRQVVFICPTTILAFQHYKNFKERLKNLPIEVGILTRFEKGKEIINKIKENKIDILIGTHRILSDDITPFLFKSGDKGGLLIIDDEHKFGVRQKEKLRELNPKLDIISLSATPIPRSLYLGLLKFKKIIQLKTPPRGRKPVKISILKFNKEKIKKAIEFELKRKGKVYFLYNRIEKLEKIKKFLKVLLKVEKMNSIGILHARLSEKKVVQILEDFQKGKINILVTTTIIEAGIDLPNVDTLIVLDSEKLGLSQLYQLQGRVGRREKQAFAWFFFLKEKLSKKARERLNILKTEKGFQIALKDLELRGAGNILGKEQSGNVNKVGLNLYSQMLSEAIEKIKYARLSNKKDKHSR